MEREKKKKNSSLQDPWQAQGALMETIGYYGDIMVL